MDLFLHVKHTGVNRTLVGFQLVGFQCGQPCQHGGNGGFEGGDGGLKGGNQRMETTFMLEIG